MMRAATAATLVMKVVRGKEAFMSARASAAAAATLAVLAFGAVGLATTAAGGAAGDPAAASYRAPGMMHMGSTKALMSAAVSSRAKVVKGVVLGGLTRQQWPVIVRTTANGKSVAEIVAGIDASTDEYQLTLPDGYLDLRVKKGRFGMTWGPEKLDFGQGYVAECSGEMRGKFSRDRSKVSGTWTYRATVRDPAGAVVANHDSGVIAWSARQ
jgi:hypothetical protein